jgi:hypothetical protein
MMASAVGERVVFIQEIWFRLDPYMIPFRLLFVQGSCFISFLYKGCKPLLSGLRNHAAESKVTNVRQSPTREELTALLTFQKDWP